MPIQFRCGMCGLEVLDKPSNRSRFCSRACHQRFVARNKRQRFCQCCRAPFTSHDARQRFCSRSCWESSRVPRDLSRTCDHCGITFLPARGHPEQRFCSLRCAHDSRARPLAERFWEKVDRTGKDCWPWMGATVLGYGRFNLNRKSAVASRVAWELTHGAVAPELEVCHSCDNPACCRPSHLFLGTHDDNMKDALRKGRMVAGPRHPQYGHPEQHPMRKLTWTQVRQIRAEFAVGRVTQGQLAERFGVRQTTISNIVHGGTWKESLGSGEALHDPD